MCSKTSTRKGDLPLQHTHTNQLTQLTLHTLRSAKYMHATPGDQTASTHLCCWGKWSRKSTECKKQHLQLRHRQLGLGSSESWTCGCNDCVWYTTLSFKWLYFHSNQVRYHNCKYLENDAGSTSRSNARNGPSSGCEQCWDDVRELIGHSSACHIRSLMTAQHLGNLVKHNYPWPEYHFKKCFALQVSWLTLNIVE